MNNTISKPELHSFCARHAQLFLGVNGLNTPKERGFLLGRGFSSHDPDTYYSRAFRFYYLTSLRKLSRKALGFLPMWIKVLKGGRYLVAAITEPRIKQMVRLSDVLESDDKRGESVRRLKPVELERLQGCEDGWTKEGILDGDNIKVCNTERSKCLGNAVTTTVVAAIITRMFLKTRR